MGRNKAFRVRSPQNRRRAKAAGSVDGFGQPNTPARHLPTGHRRDHRWRAVRLEGFSPMKPSSAWSSANGPSSSRWTSACGAGLLWGSSSNKSLASSCIRAAWASTSLAGACVPQKPIKRAYEQSPAAAQAWLEGEYPAIEQRARAGGAEIHWRDETALVNTDVRGRSFAPAGKTPVVMAVGHSTKALHDCHCDQSGQDAVGDYGGGFRRRQAH